MVFLGGSLQSRTAYDLGRARLRGIFRSIPNNRACSSCLLLLVAFLASHTPLLLQIAGAQETTPSEYAVKANILRSILSFVEWPLEVLSADSDEQLIICVLGVDPFGEELGLAMDGQTVGGRTASILRAEVFHAIGFCHVLFISASEAARLSKVLLVLENLPVLTVGDMNGFAENGGMIGIEVVDGKYGLAVNRDVVERAQLKLSSRLLRLARLVHNDHTAMEP